MAAIQFYGQENVLQAYRNAHVDTWAIFQGNEINAAGSGEGELTTYLDLLAPAGSAAIYKLRVYRNLEPDQITNKTDFNGSFNFRLLSDGQAAIGGIPPTGRGGYGDPVLVALSERYKKKALDLMMDDLEGTSQKPKGIMGTITDLLENDPETLVTVIGKLKEMFFPTLGSVPMQVQAPRMAGSTQTINTPPSTNMTPEEKMNRIAEALDTLEQYDPKLLTHLEALANLAKTDTDLFRSIIKKLDLL